MRKSMQCKRSHRVLEDVSETPPEIMNCATSSDSPEKVPKPPSTSCRVATVEGSVPLIPITKSRAESATIGGNRAEANPADGFLSDEFVRKAPKPI